MSNAVWSDTDISNLTRFYEQNRTIKSISKELKRTVSSIRNKAYKLKITSAGTWSEYDIQHLKGAYESIAAVSSIAAKLNRSFASIACKAHELQITKDPGAHVVTEENNQKSSDRMKRRIALGLVKTTGWSKSGIRQDLGIYFRSTWEANYARYLNLLVGEHKIKRWEYEPVRFEFEGIKRGTRSYLPDFRIFYEDDIVEWHEIKGYMTQKGRTAIKRFKKYYPKESFVLVDRKAYKILENKYASMISNWEK